MEAAPHKTIAVWSLTFHFKNHPSKRKTCETLLEKNEVKFFNGPTTHGHASVDQTIITYLHQLCASTGCSLEDLLGAMDDRVRWRERVREMCAASTT